MRADAQHIRTWMSQHDSLLMDSVQSAAFEHYIESCPWVPSRLNWALIEHLKFDMDVSWESRIVEFVTQTPLGRHSHVMCMYNGSEPSIVGLRDDVLHDVDLIYSSSPGARYFCGVDMFSGVPVPAFEDFAEFDGAAVIRFRV